jgi:hypothetical protein
MRCNIHIVIETLSKAYYRKLKIKNILNSKSNIQKHYVCIYLENWEINSNFYYKDPIDDYEIEYNKLYDSIKYTYFNNYIVDLKPNSSRDYGLFGVLVGVRWYNCPNKISECRGLPSDVSKEISLFSDYYGSDGHSHSYLTFEELLNYKHWEEYNLEYFYDNIKEMQKIINLPPQDIRMVFWFDN